MSAQKITLTTSDGVDIEVERQVIECSILIKSLLGADSGQAPILNINEQVMRKVIEWCEQHKKYAPAFPDNDPDNFTDINEWDREFILADQEILFEIILAAEYLDIKALLDIGCKTVANMIKGKSPNEIIQHYSQDRLFSLRSELHVMILEHLESEVDMMAFASISARLCRVLTSDLYERSSLLQFLYHAKRPLTIAEAADILAVKPERTPSFHPTSRMQDPEKVLKLFPNLLTIDNNEVRLARFVKDLISRDYGRESRAHVKITEVLLAYLSSLSVEEDDDIWTVQESFPLAEYASTYWMDHARIAEEECEAVRQLILDFCLCPELWETFMDYFDSDHPNAHAKTAGWNEFIRPSPLYMTSMGNMRHTVEGLLREGQDPNEDCGVLGGALFAACEVGSKEIVQLLLDYGADVNRPGHHPDGGHATSALTVAIENGRVQLVEPLIEHEANPDLPGSYIPNDTFVTAVSILPIHLASVLGYEGIIEALLGTDTQSYNMVHEFEGTALRVVLNKARDALETMDSARTALGMARTALEMAKARVVGDRARAALDSAFAALDSAFAALALSRAVSSLPRAALDRAGAVLDSARAAKALSRAAKALSRAALDRDMAFLGRHKAVLDRARDALDSAGAALDSAMSNSQILKMLLDRGADVNIQGPDKETDFHTACAYHDEETVMLLIKRGKVDLEASHGFLGNALQAASFCNHIKAVDLLLKKGAVPTGCTWLAAFNPTQTDVRQVLDDLQCIPLGSGKTLPLELALSIVSTGYSPRVVKHAVREERYRANNFWKPGPHASVAGLYLTTESIPGADSSLHFCRVIPQRIVFQVIADQGLVPRGGDGTRGSWCVFFEVSILRPTSREPLALEDLLHDTWETPPHASDALKKKGWEFLNEASEFTWRVCNIGAGDDYGNCRVEWRRECTEVCDDNRVGSGEGFLELLQPGYVVVLWARAVGQSWENNVKAAKIEIEYDLR